MNTMMSKRPRRPNPKSLDCPIDEVLTLADELLKSSIQRESPAESAQMERLAGLIENPQAKALSLLMTDRLFRSDRAPRAAKGWRDILCQVGIGFGFDFGDRLLLRTGSLASRIFPAPVMAAVKSRLQSESKGVILPAEEPALSQYLSSRCDAGVRVNLNQLGEAVLGEEEAGRRLEDLLALLARPDVNYVSVKISAIFSQINLVAWDSTLDSIKSRLRRLYRAALPEGKFVNLDMEEYRELELTVAAFREVLDEDEFRELSAGLVLQAYLPDSIEAQRSLTEWARARCAAGGAAIKIRIVKGANLAMEKVEAEWHGWYQAPHPSKHHTDACFKRMLEFACQAENAAVVKLGVGSHNLFDVALALVLRRLHGVSDAVEIEMLEGMAAPQARAVQVAANGLLFYAPLVRKENFGSALAYLIRRLDENTSPGNFLADLFSITPDSVSWQSQKDHFLKAWHARNTIDSKPRRLELPKQGKGHFFNQADSDWTQPDQRLALAEAFGSCVPGKLPPLADIAEIETTLEVASAVQPEWEKSGIENRSRIVRDCAQQLASSRFEAIALLRDEGKKAVAEADTEISEAIDFARYYASTSAMVPGTRSQALGTVVVAPPWNFPFAIPCGGVFAALMAGNAVILKPAPESVRIAWFLVRQLWQAGVPEDVLHFAACDEGDAGRCLIEDKRTDAVILTGAYDTARLFQQWRPSLKLFAETSGKNAMVVSALADRELAVRDLVRSAFGHAGQKCSAASLGILEAEVYDDPVFRRQLKDAAASLPVGSARDLTSIVTPLIQEPGDDLLRALTALDEGESWLLEPRVSAEDPCLWSPGIKLGVRPGSWFHYTECFGPVLGIMRAADLDEATRFQNAVSYGLTAGFHSLDEAEIDRWKSRVQSGNLYINRGITGAIVQRQPFGGWKQSSIGPGAKAGGPNYVNMFRRCHDVEELDSRLDLEFAEADYRKAWEFYFSVEHDPSGLRCESNVFRYQPCRGILLRLSKTDSRAEGLARLAAKVSGVPLIISDAGKESEQELVARLPQLALDVEFFRTVGDVPGDALLRAFSEANINWIDAPFSAVGRLELTHWTREQSVTETRHRYGNVFEQGVNSSLS